jgi:Flp pilus assembly protein TadG
VIVFPLTVLVFMTLVQWGLYFHAGQVVDAAAQDAARAAQTRLDDGDAAEAAAADLLRPAQRSGLLSDASVDVSGDAGRVRAVVTGDVIRLVPIPIVLRVTGTAGGPVESFVAEPDRR